VFLTTYTEDPEVIEAVNTYVSSIATDRLLLPDPRVLQTLRSTYSLIRVEGQHLIDQVLGIRRCMFPLHRLEGVLSVCYLGQNGVIVRAHEGWVSTQQDVKDNTYTPNI
jgi:hypothetical protein